MGRIDTFLKETASKARGRTRYPGQEPFWDEEMAAEIEALRAEVKRLRAAFVDLWSVVPNDAPLDDDTHVLADALLQETPDV